VSDPAVEVAGLRKAYGQHEAVKGIDLSVARGEVFGFLGTQNVAVLAAWGIAGLIVAARGFRWEPHAHRG